MIETAALILDYATQHPVIDTDIWQYHQPTYLFVVK